jgi:hypothetical protein
MATTPPTISARHDVGHGATPAQPAAAAGRHVLNCVYRSRSYGNLAAVEAMIFPLRPGLTIT